MQENSENKAIRGCISQIILRALSFGNKYGYEICKDIEVLSKGKLVLKQPSLYSCLRRMEEQNLISSYWEDSDQGGRRHYYSITEKGREKYEDNKKIWKTDDELVNSLPTNEIFEGSISPRKISNPEEDSNEKLQSEDKNLVKEINSSSQNDNTSLLSPATKSDTLYVLDQENLFNLTRKNQEIKKINNENEDSDSSKSFLQFDFFEQNIKFVKQTSPDIKKEPQIFTNKFSNMDNHSNDIEPFDKKLKDSKGIKKEDSFSNLIFTKDDIKSFSRENAVLNSNSLNNSSTKNSLNEIKNNDSNLNKNQSIPKISNDTEEITWNNPNNSDNTDAPIFDIDYKQAIGKLYSNSQLKDPYEQNKFQTFKEIFPSSNLKEEQKQIESSNDSKIDAVIKSSSNSNIDCDDIKMLNNLYILQGLNIKMHNNNKNKAETIYKDKNRLHMVCMWLITILGLIELGVSFLLLKNNSLILANHIYIYISSILILLIFSISFTLKNVFDKYKLVVIKRNFVKDFTISLLAFILLIITTFAINIAFGMTNLLQIEYLSFWLIPCLVLSNILVYVLIYYLLLKSKYFNS